MAKPRKKLIEALETILPKGSSDGLTVHEIARQTGKHSEWVRIKLQAVKEAGLLVCERKLVEAIDGRKLWVAAYKIKDISRKGR